MSSRAIRAGRAFVELFANDSALTRTLDKAAAKVRAFGGTVAGIGAKAGAAGGAVLAPLGKALFDALGKGAEIKRIALQYGQTSRTISELAGAFGVAGSGMEEFSGTLDGLAGKIKGAADGNAELVDGLRGLRGRDLINLPLADQLDRIAERFKGIVLPADQAVVAADLFGAAGAKLLPFLRDGAAGLARLKAEAQKAGGVMDDESIDRSYEATKALNLVWEELKNTVVDVGAALLPTSDQTKTLTERVREAFASARAWVAENKNLIIAAAALGAGLVGLGVALMAAKVLFVALAAGIGLVGTALTVLLSPVGLAVAALAGIAGWFVTCTTQGKAFASDVGAAFEGMGEIFRETWGGIVEAVKAGDMQRAFAILGAGVKALWRELLLTLKKGWNSFVGGLTDVIKNNPMLLPVIGAAIGTAAGGPVGTVVGLGAGVGLNFVDIQGRLSADLADAAKGAKEAKDELRALLAAGRGAGAAGVGGDIQKGLDDERKRFESYTQKIADGIAGAESLGNRQKGIFSGPVAQQLGIGDTVAKRQLDVQKDIKKAAERNAVLQAEMVGEMQKVLGLVVWN